MHQVSIRSPANFIFPSYACLPPGGRAGGIPGRSERCRGSSGGCQIGPNLHRLAVAGHVPEEGSGKTLPGLPDPNLDWAEEAQQTATKRPSGEDPEPRRYRRE